MPKFNIYKIIKSSQNNLVNKLIEVGLEMTNTQIIDNLIFEFYFSTIPDEVDIWWAGYYNQLIGLQQPPTNKNNFGLLLIYDEDICYAISLGKSHFYIKQFCDTDFGINLAERIIDTQNLRLKNSKHYKTQKNKSITSYLNNTLLDYESGESLHFIKAKTIDPNLWGKIASFGNSALITLDITPTEIPNLINRIENKLLDEPITNIPKAEKITDENRLRELDLLLVDYLLNENEENIDSEEINISGVDFIFSDNNNYQFKLKRSNIESDIYDDLSIENLRSFINDNNIDLTTSIDDVSVVIIRGEGIRNFSKSIKHVIEFMTSERECLLDGRWHQFNQSYIELLINYVNQIPLNYDPNFDYQNITEDDFNSDREDDGYTNVHTDSITLARRFKVEKMDLYNNETLFFVKKGNPQKLGYVIDQALNTVTLLKNNEFKIEQNGTDLRVKKICLWLLITNRVSNISNASELNSIIFLMKLMHLNKEILNNGFEKLEININYIR